ncbi:MAG TPA: SEFIR domain-containing protein [Verrucomicrobiae bacterium]|nr:SEFIR domain-containing protein [Verrucomicrobiae bacterium]
MNPKAFISYSWTSESHRELVRNWADRLMADGVNIVLDQYDLKEGHDKYVFMEKMVTDPSVTNVLVICDRTYAEKADARKAGVGTESQIMSQEIYNKVEQSKFIPILCELSEAGEPYLPTFMKSRIGINFSSPELVNENWEQLVRLLFGKPLYQKPAVGKPPVYVSEDKPTPSNPAFSKFASFKQAFLQGKKGINTYREDFLSACYEYADSLRVRQRPTDENFGQRVLEDCGKLVQIRDLIIDWVLLEANTPGDAQFQDALSTTLEKLIELRSRPTEITSWQDWWFEAHELFVYETFLYLIAALLKVSAFATLHEVFTSNYLRSESETYNLNDRFVSFNSFWASSGVLNSLLAPKGQTLLSPAAALLKRQATRKDLSFESIMEADLFALLFAAIYGQDRWYPQTLFYAGYGKIFPFFLRASQHKNFTKLSIITGIQTAEDLRKKTKEGLERMRVDQWTQFSMYANTSFWNALNMDKLDTIK